MEKRVYNFSAGPSILPLSALQQAQKDLISYQGSGMSVMEMSHRSKLYDTIITTTTQDIKRIFKISDKYDVLWLHGGASLQFSMVPMNLYVKDRPMLYINTGAWSKKAVTEGKRVGPCQVIASSEDKNNTYIPDVKTLNIDQNASFLHITSNNTIFSTQYTEFPNSGAVPLVADMSSDILSKEIDVNQFGLIYAGAQKNLGPAGVTLVIIRKDLIERGSKDLPTMLQYRTHTENASLYNTPPCFSIYIIGLVLKWIDQLGGLKVVEQMNNKKAALLYQAIDDSDFYYSPVEKNARSKMNIAFRIKGNNEELEAKLIKEAKENGLLELKGHRSVGGLRASLYNAMPIEGVQALVNFMKEFEKKNS